MTLCYKCCGAAKSKEMCIFHWCTAFCGTFAGMLLFQRSLPVALLVAAAGAAAGEPWQQAQGSANAQLRLPRSIPAAVQMPATGIEQHGKPVVQVQQQGSATLLVTPDGPRDQRRVELRQALQPQRQPPPPAEDPALQSRQLSPKERLEMRQMLRQQRRDAEVARPG